MPDHRINTGSVMPQKEEKLKEKNHCRSLGILPGRKSGYADNLGTNHQ